MTETPRDIEPNNPAVGRQPGAPASHSPGDAPDAMTAQPPASGAEIATGRAETVEAPPVAARSEPAGAAGPERHQVTRTGMVWVAVASALVVLILLIAFILQNQDSVSVKFFGLEGAVSLGIALFIAAVGGGVLVAIAGAARIIQLRLAAHRQRSKTVGRS
jgi:uncharacterized integral membrane protein